MNVFSLLLQNFGFFDKLLVYYEEWKTYGIETTIMLQFSCNCFNSQYNNFEVHDTLLMLTLILRFMRQMIAFRERKMQLKNI